MGMDCSGRLSVHFGVRDARGRTCACANQGTEGGPERREKEKDGEREARRSWRWRLRLSGWLHRKERRDFVHARARRDARFRFSCRCRLSSLSICRSRFTTGVCRLSFVGIPDSIEPRTGVTLFNTSHNSQCVSSVSVVVITIVAGFCRVSVLRFCGSAVLRFCGSAVPRVVLVALEALVG